MKREPISRPILFQADMVRALRAGRKTQTRRTRGLDEINERPDDFEFTGLGLRPRDKLIYATFVDKKNNQALFVKSPYGMIGDRLWVRETFLFIDDVPIYKTYDDQKHENYINRLKQLGDMKWKPSIHMPRLASRDTLEITDVRIERLQAISEADAIAEGIDFDNGKGRLHRTAKIAYSNLWESINGQGSWAKNPWLWVVDFRRM